MKNGSFCNHARLVTRITVDDPRMPKGDKTRHVPLSEGAQGILRSCDSFVRSEWLFPGLKDVAPCRTVPRFLSLA